MSDCFLFKDILKRVVDTCIDKNEMWGNEEGHIGSQAFTHLK
jgi:hypothetical protein